MEEKVKKDNSAKGKAAREKGKRYELELAHIFQREGYPARRSVQYSGRGNGAADLVGIPALSVESKAVERLNVRKAYEQAVENATGTDGIPVVCHKQSRKEWLVTLSLADFLKMYKTFCPPKSDDQ